MAAPISEALLQCELFRTLTEQEVQPISALCQAEQYEVGEAVFTQGDQGSKIYFIKDGLVTLERSVDLGDRKAKVRIAALGRGKAFGCWLALLGDVHNLMSSAVCSKKTEAISVEGPDLRSALKNDPWVGIKVMERLTHMLAGRLRGVFGAMEKL